MKLETHACPSCGSEEVSRNGQNRHGKQNYLCRDCGRQFVDNPTWKAITTEQQGLIDRMLLERISLAGIARVLQNIKSFIRSNLEGGYVAECLEISVVTQGDTLDKVVDNLIEAVSLHLEGENTEDFGLVPNPSIFVTFELQPEYVTA